MKKLFLLLIPITLITLCGCSVEKDFGKTFICTYSNGDFEGVLIGETNKQYMLYNGDAWSVSDKPMSTCNKLPPKGINMLSGWEYLGKNFKK